MKQLISKKFSFPFFGTAGEQIRVKDSHQRLDWRFFAPNWPGFQSNETQGQSPITPASFARPQETAPEGQP